MAPIETTLKIEAKPYIYECPVRKTALLVIDMQRDFLCPNGFGEIQGGTLDAVQASIVPVKKLLETCRRANLPIFHTREGNKPDLSDCPSSKTVRQNAAPGNTQHLKVIGDMGKMGRLLIRGENGHDFVDDLQPLPNEVVIDKPGKGAFWQTTLMNRLKNRGVTHILMCGVTTECCFATTLREANDRGFECCGVEEGTAGYNDDFKCPTLEMIHWSQGLFGFVCKLKPLLDALEDYTTQPVSFGSGMPPQIPPAFDGNMGIRSLQTAFRSGLSPLAVVETVFARIEKYQEIDSAVWIHIETKEAVLLRARTVCSQWPDRSKLPPLFGVPFSIKDSIDIAGLPTTTACLPLERVPSSSAPLYTLLLQQGAIFIGKTNLEQLATGLTGCRSPYGIPRSVYNHDYICGGSSSGSCVSVGANLVSFSIGTDTAGSGRVPAGFNGIVGYKPTRGLLSAGGITPACLSLDCVAVLAHYVEDSRIVFDLCAEYDENDRYAKVSAPIERHVNSTGIQTNSFTFGIPPLEALAVCNPVYRRKFDKTVQDLQAIGGTLKPIDWNPFERAGKLLYEGTFVSERLANLPNNWIEQNQEHLHPVIKQLFNQVIARKSTAVEAYRDIHLKALYTRQAEKVFSYSSEGVDVVVVPTAPTHYTVEEVIADPIAKNSVLGEYSHSANVLDLCAIAVPAGLYPVGDLSGESNDQGTLPFSITMLSGSNMDAEVLAIAQRFEERVNQV